MILILDGDMKITELEKYALSSAGYEVNVVTCEKELFKTVEKKLPQLIILDTIVNGEDGYNILRNIRENSNTRFVPVMFVAEANSELDKVKGLDAGADEFVSKPFGIMEFVSRVNALVRRIKNIAMLNNTVLSYENISIDESSREVRIDGNACPLTYKEYELLKYMVTNRGIVLSREKMVENVWGFDFQGESRTVDMHIKSLRQKMGQCGSYIKTVRNVGYKLSS